MSVNLLKQALVAVQSGNVCFQDWPDLASVCVVIGLPRKAMMVVSAKFLLGTMTTCTLIDIEGKFHVVRERERPGEKRRRGL